MGSGKRHQRNAAKPPPQLRSRTTRSSKGRLLSDPAENNQLLNEQLRSLGLYAAPTVGDGNCLFRALSDQLHGTPSKHAQLRQEVCDWIERHQARYEPFVEDERGLETHLRCMRENATYGGHMELSAFAHLTKRNVKVIQPGLVYVIEWAAGGDPSSSSTPERKVSSSRYDDSEEEDEQDNQGGTIYVAYHDWEHFSSIRNLKGPHSGLPNVREAPAHIYTEPPAPPSPAEEKKAIPKVKLKLSAPPSAASSPAPESKPSSTVGKASSSAGKLASSTGKPKSSASEKPKSKSKSKSSSSTSTITAAPSGKPTSSISVLSATPSSGLKPEDPALIPLPSSRSASPGSLPISSSSQGASSSASLSSLDTLSSSSSGVSFNNLPPGSPMDSSHPFTTYTTQTPLPPGSPMKLLHTPNYVNSFHASSGRTNRSPKRSFDESSASGEETGQEREKRSRSSLGMEVDDEREGEQGEEGGMDYLPVPKAKRGAAEGGAEGEGDEEDDGEEEDESEEMEDEEDVSGDTPGLSAGGSSSSSSSSPSSTRSSSSSPPPEPEPTVAYEKPLTRRQRKALGLPKPRAALAYGRGTGNGLAGSKGRGAGKIVIPGGKYKGRVQVGVGEGEGADEEWRRNGTGRVDVRGFRELKI
ncbi:hypothetical protein BDQ12DRAFT_143460 [Crucibulum laeve]|uniref:OTU domain-containing protein n=1 Tax=Crucibulum laeve TaxID=68775 RepID=A0A5C3M048_9AGAR|nr:hypothetical protein BDQ12DRAFT_143460 [Crucibulum laeve]